MNLLIIVTIAVLLFVFAVPNVVLATAWRDCGSKLGRVFKVEVAGCEKKHRCDLRRGKNETLAVTFEAQAYTTDVHADVFGVMGGLPVPYPIPAKDACKSKLLPCPLSANSRYIYKNVIYVENAYPKISLVVKWILKNGDNHNLACVLIPVKIV